MKYIINCFEFLITTIRTIWDFFVGLLENLLMLIEYLTIVAEICYETIESMPSWLQSFAIITILISVLYMILGRETGGNKQ